jgi:hypothetical protein
VAPAQQHLPARALRLLALLVLAVAVAACGPAVGEPRPVAVERSPAAPAELLLVRRAPFQQWPTLQARAVGLLVQYDSPYGRLVGWTRGLRRLEDTRFPSSNSRYYSATDGASPWAMYFASQGEGHNVLRHWQVTIPQGRWASFPLVAMYEPQTRNPYGLHAPAHLVEVEVNGGQGAAPGVHFVATGCRVLDGTRRYPIVVADALAAARRRFDEVLARDRSAVAAALARAASAPGAEPYGPTTTLTHEGVSPTWLRESQRLRVLFYRAVTATSFKSEPAPIAGDGSSPGPWRPRPGPITRTRTHGVELGLEVEFDQRGRMVAERVYAPTPLSREALQALGMSVER